MRETAMNRVSMFYEVYRVQEFVIFLPFSLNFMRNLHLEYRTRAIISGRSKISMARKFSKISMPKTLKPYFLDIIVDTKA